MRQGIAQRDRAFELVGEIVGAPGLAVKPEGGGLVYHLGAGGERVRSALDAGIERRGVDKRLEDGSRLPLRQNVVELADAVIAPAGQRLHLAGVRIDGYQGHLRIGRRLAPEAALPLDLRVHFLHAETNGLPGLALEAQVDGGVNAEGVGLEIGVLELALHRVVDHVDEVGPVSIGSAGRRAAAAWSWSWLL